MRPLSLLVVLLVLSGARGAPVSARDLSNDLSDGTFRLLHLTDVHFDPLADTVRYNASSFCRPTQGVFFSNSNRNRMNGLSLSAEDDDHRRHTAQQLDASLSEFFQVLTARQAGSNSDRRATLGGAFGRFGCDTPAPLLASGLSAIKQAPFMQVAVVTGDWAAHNLDISAALKLKAVQVAAQALQAALPAETVVLPGLGNNDFFPDYNATCFNAMVETISGASYFGPWIPSDQLANFRKMGAMALRPAALPGLLLVSINTVLYASNNPNNAVPSNADPCGQFAWLRTQLAAARSAGERVILAGHVVPGVNSFRGSGRAYFAGNYSATLTAIVDEFSDIIPLQLYGHTHSDEFRLMWQTPSVPSAGLRGSAQQSLLVAPSLTPIFGNNPTFRTFTMGSATQGYIPKDYSQMFLNLIAANGEEKAVWAELYDWQQQYGNVGGANPSISTQALVRIADALLRDPTLLDAWMARRSAGTVVQEVVMMCALGSETQDTFVDCLNRILKAAGTPGNG